MQTETKFSSVTRESSPSAANRIVVFQVYNGLEGKWWDSTLNEVVTLPPILLTSYFALLTISHHHLHVTIFRSVAHKLCEGKDFARKTVPAAMLWNFAYFCSFYIPSRTGIWGAGTESLELAAHLCLRYWWNLKMHAIWRRGEVTISAS
jgi:hypothetical protein